MSEYRSELKQDMRARLGKIEGQVRGLSRMIDEGRDCHAVLQQFAAVRAAVQSASLHFAREYVCHSLEEGEPGELTPRERMAVELIDVLGKVI